MLWRLPLIRLQLKIGISTITTVEDGVKRFGVVFEYFS